MAQRRTDLDALRSFAMLLGVAMDASLSLSRRLATEEAAGTNDGFYGLDTSLGLIGVFHRFFRNPSPTVSWLADAS